MRALVDADILLYEVGHAAEVGWKSGDLPSFDYVLEILNQRLDRIVWGSGADNFTLFITEGKTFRYDLAKKKPYKGNRKSEKPYHFNNLKVYMRDVLDAEIVSYIEADDAMAIAQIKSKNPEDTIIVSRDKDLKQVPGYFYSWEMGAQPEFGPELITKEGDGLSLSKKRDKIIGTGLPFFYSQVLTGDVSDNIPGLPGCGAVAAMNILGDASVDAMLSSICDEYRSHYGASWEEELLEQGRLCFMTRRLHIDGKPVLWEIEMED